MGAAVAADIVVSPELKSLQVELSGAQSPPALPRFAIERAAQLDLVQIWHSF
jgi:hypothetical protein